MNAPTNSLPRLLLFGPPRFSLAGGETVPLPSERRHQLVVWLALKRSWVGRAEIAALLWPELPRKLAFTNLRKALHRLQETPWHASLEMQGQALRFAEEGRAPTDVAAFEAALDNGHLGEALALHTSELLVGFEDDGNEAWSAWLRYERERLRAAWREAALTRLEQFEQSEPVKYSGASERVLQTVPIEAQSAVVARATASALRASDSGWGAAIELSARLLEADPLDEAALAAHLRALARNGQLGEARQAWRAFSERLQRELGIEPAAALKAMFEKLVSTGGGHSAAPAHGESTTAALATTPPDDGFVGRASELQHIATLLVQPDCHVLCLIGPGGVGKTRLARRALHELAPRFADGAHFVPLEDVAAVSDIGTRLAGVLGLPLGGQGVALDRVRQALQEREMLLVLDNFEHLAESAGWLDEFRRDAPRLKLLITSRVRPLAQAVWTLPIEGLPCPEALDADRVEAFDAARLFVRAAQRVAPGLIATTEAAAIVDICQQVDGLPLALELAASWTRVLSCEAIAAELRAGTELLRTADPTRPARQASIEAVFEQSWRHLAPAEREALARLAVFRGGFTAAAARAVAAASLPVLGALADKSLLRKDGSRCQLHPLVQQFAAERLEALGTRAEAERAHAEYFQQLVQQQRSQLVLGQREALALFDAEFENCRAAWHRAVARGQHEELAAHAPALRDFCDNKGRYADGLALLNEALATYPAGADVACEALLASAAAHMAYRLDRYAEAEAGAQRALGLLGLPGGSSPLEATTPSPIAHEAHLQCLRTLGVCALMQGRYAEARAPLQQALEMAEADGELRIAAGMLDNLSLIEKAAGRFDQARRMSSEALVQYRRLCHTGGMALCLNNLGSLAVVLHEPELARTYFEECLQVCEHHGLPGTRTNALANLAELALAAGRLDEAEALASRALEATRELGNRGVEAWLLQVLAAVALDRNELPEARSRLKHALAASVQVQHAGLLLEGLILLARVLHAMGEREAAHQVLGFVAQHEGAPAALVAAAKEQLQRWQPWQPALPPARPAHEGAAAAPVAHPPWHGVSLSAFIERIVRESDQAYAPLIEALRR